MVQESKDIEDLKQIYNEFDLKSMFFQNYDILDGNQVVIQCTYLETKAY